MVMLNRTAAEMMVEIGAHACTDVTGFGLIGHLGTMASASRVNVEIMWDDLPVLPGVLQCLADGIVSGAAERNREAFEQCVRSEEGVDATMLDLCFDAQTSGGLLIGVKETDAPVLLRRLHERGVVQAVQIGFVSGPGAGEVTVRTNGSQHLPPPRIAVPAGQVSAVAEAVAPLQDSSSLSHSADCCGDAAMPADASGVVVASSGSGAEAKFHEFMQAANAPGLLDARTKKAMAIALSVITKCEPCLKSHIKKAREMGFSQEEIDEAAWVAIAFGGAPLMMFYKRLRR
jgi:AhpD family alkylhydroperoxidase